MSVITTWFEDTFPPGYGLAAMWAAAFVLALVALLILMRIVRALRSGTFVAGGRNRKPRLAVMDATPIDAKRRLVLVRRDDVEHLILIGGANDLVIEQGITLIERSARPAQSADPGYAETAPLGPPSAPARAIAPPAYAPPQQTHYAPPAQPAYAPPPAQPSYAPPAQQRPDASKTQRPVTQIRDLAAAPTSAPQRAPVQANAPVQAAPASRQTQPPVSRPRTDIGTTPPAPQRPQSEPLRQSYSPPARSGAEITPPPRAPSTQTIPSVSLSRPPAESQRSSGLSAPTIAPVRRPVTPAPSQSNTRPASGANVDDALLKELSLGMERERAAAASSAADISLDDEMAKLLGELSRDKR